MLYLKTPSRNAKVSLQTDEQRRFVEDEARRASVDGSLSFKWYDVEMVGAERSYPLPVSFAWVDEFYQESDKSGYYYLLISENEDMQDPWVYITELCCYDVYNLKIGTTYFWCVQKNGKRSETFSFKTLLTLPRCIKIDKATNVRDVGGYRVEEGQIRQGLVYRGSEFEPHIHLSPKGIEELRRLAVNTELDMRGEAKGQIDFTTGEIIGMKRVYVPCRPYVQVFDKEQRSAAKNFFKVFTDPKNYPIYFHCHAGADRTGTFAFILGAFIGMNYEDLICEYEFTSLSVAGTRTRNYYEFHDFLVLFMGLPGKSLRQKSTTFLKEYAGLTDKQLAVIYDILVEKD